MLVLTRQKDQSIMIGDVIELMVVDIRGDKVRLGIKAPTDIRIYRKEIYEAIQRENIEAARAATPDLEKVEKLLREGVHTQEKPEKAPEGGEESDKNGPKS